MRLIKSNFSSNPEWDESELSILLRRKRIRVVKWQTISTLKTRYPHRDTYRLHVDNGDVLKGRQVRRPIYARRMRRFLSCFPSSDVAPVLATYGRAVLEQWISGPTVDELAWDEGLLFASGSLLGQFHRAVPVGTVARGAADLRALIREYHDALSALRRRAVISPQMSDKLLRHAIGRLPERSRWGLVHRDFCAENLVMHRGSPCVIDNVTVRLGFLEEDLARWWYRWPMTKRQRGNFLSGYATHSDPELFLRNQQFWMVVASVLAAAFRTRAGASDLSAACREFCHWCSDEATLVA